MPAPVVRVLRLPGADPDVPLPSYETPGSAGADVRANFPVAERGGVTLAPGARRLIPTGLSVEIPPDHEIQVRPRSGLALKHGISLVNAPGTIDSDYRGPVGVILVNLGDQPFAVRHGDRIAQLVVAPVHQARFEDAPRLAPSQRGGSGFGSTGNS